MISKEVNQLAKKRKTQRKTRRQEKSSTGNFIIGVFFFILVVGLGFFIWMNLGNQVDYSKYEALADQYENYYVEEQGQIMMQVQSDGIDPIQVGHVFIPENPALYPDVSHVYQHQVPYFNQNDPRWGELAYGNDSSQELWENGCAIVSLAMVDSYFSHSTTYPQEILSWAGNDHYVYGQGTSWSIYPAFAEAYGYEMVALENDFHTAMDYLNSGYLIVVAVGPGTFTQGGHVMVVRGYDGYNVYLNDPNDSPQNFFSIQGVPAQTLVNDGMAYWAFRK